MCVTWAEMPKIAALIRHIEDLHARHGRSYILRAGISSLFRYIEGVHGERPWGTVLDAGTGVKSLQWIQTLADRALDGGHGRPQPGGQDPRRVG